MEVESYSNTIWTFIDNSNSDMDQEKEKQNYIRICIQFGKKTFNIFRKFWILVHIEFR